MLLSINAPKSDPMLGRGQKIGKWYDDHKEPIVSTLSAIGIVVFGVLLQDPKWYLWVCMVVFIILMIYGTVLSIKTKKRESVHTEKISRLEKELINARDPKRVFFLTSALNDNWQLQLEQSLLHQLRTRGFRPTIFTPLKNFSLKEQECHFNEILERPDDYIGGFVIPVSPEKQRKEISEFVLTFGKPIVFVDNAPFTSEGDYRVNTSFVGVNNERGGEIAARAVLDCHRKNTISTILIIASPVQSQRQDSFIKLLAKEAPMINVMVDDGGRFSRIDACQAVLRNLREARKVNSQIDIIFCTSDSMTLGCLDAIKMIEDWGFMQPPRVIGYDGIFETKRLVEKTASPLIHIVIQEHHEVAAGAVAEFDQLLNNQRKNPIHLLDPHLYPSIVCAPEMKKYESKGQEGIKDAH